MSEKRPAAEVRHINQIGSYAKLCGASGGQGTWRSDATCKPCCDQFDAAHARSESDAEFLARRGGAS